jgi:predicted Zn-dependent peptidase
LSKISKGFMKAAQLNQFASQ